ncbi:bifunctional methylenetetrahydrofolate dehydrogenase/methenyltetrahydrofolate cyclohydrolase [Streptomyces sp. T028]|uniref:bifunctional methylenetetrahydrofolate dehydrogenase/methenyltetrahydrofolate cyclohydrolase n=1 Tax=Streptomyces sp. T028 TaxID=3394379 RepID=UPI003A885CC9
MAVPEGLSTTRFAPRYADRVEEWIDVYGNAAADGVEVRPLPRRLLYRWDLGELPVDIPLVVSDHPDLAPITQRYGIPFVHLPVTRDTKPDAEAELLRRNRVPITGRQFCVIGCGITVGRPLGLMPTRSTEHATVTLCHEATQDTAAHARVADVVVAAAGVAHLVKPDWIKPAATVLSVGITRTAESVLGDVHPGVDQVAGSVAPPVGGVGPMTRAMLLTNIVEAAERGST